MYVFALMALLGLVVMKLVDLAGHLGTRTMHPAVKVILAALLGVAASWATRFSVFASWGIDVRSAAAGYVGTGLVIAAMASALHSIVGLIDGLGRKARDEAEEIEEKHLRAA